MSAVAAAISARGVRQSYGGREVLRGVDLDVHSGTIQCLLGANGAGKTTLLSMMSTLIGADVGRIRVLGLDPRTDGALIREQICVTGQAAAVDELLTARENIVMFARLFGIGRTQAGPRADALLERFELDGTQRSATLSGGQRRRLDLALCLIRTPRLLFLDEPTTGLDLTSRTSLWQAVREVRDKGTTVMLTTQYLEEATQLADEVSVLHEGVVVASGSPADLISRVGEQRVELIDDLGKEIASCPTDASPSSVLAGLEQMREAAPGDLTVRITRPTMEDVYLALTTAPAPQTTVDAPQEV
jgi:ABC-2 type transport system ATP-binding protein